MKFAAQTLEALLWGLLGIAFGLCVCASLEILDLDRATLSAVAK